MALTDQDNLKSFYGVQKLFEPPRGDAGEMVSKHEKFAVLIVSYGNANDVDRCLTSLSRSNWTGFEVFVCENAGEEAYARLVMLLTREDGPLLRPAALEKP